MTAPSGRPISGRQQLVLQIICLLITATVLFPILWIFSLALDPRNLSRPDSLIPPGASLDAFARVIAQPTSDDDRPPRARPEQLPAGLERRAVLGRHRGPRGVRVLAPPVPLPRGR